MNRLISLRIWSGTWRGNSCGQLAAFEEARSPWDKTTAERFRSILLATGNETDHKETYRKFRSPGPEVKYILKKRGFPVPGELG